MHSCSLINLATWNAGYKEQLSRIYRALCYKHAPRTSEIDVTSYVIALLLAVMILVTVGVLNTTHQNYRKGSDYKVDYVTAH